MSSSIEQRDSNSSKRQSPLPVALKPPATRRAQLPCEQIFGGPVSFTSILTRNLPICVFEPLTDVQASAEEIRYAKQYLNRMCEVNDPVERLSLLCGFVVSGYSGMVGRRRKPFNPLLGETYDYISEDGWHFHSEQVSHHPAITVCHAQSNDKNWEICQALQPKLSFSLNTISITSIHPVRLHLLNGDEYSWNKITTTIQNCRAEAQNRKVLNTGDMFIKTNFGFEAQLKFHEIDNAVTGEIMKNGAVVQQLTGSWDKGLNKVLPNGQLVKIFEPIPLPERNAKSYYGFSEFAISLNELQPYQHPYLPPTDSRYRPDQRHLENGEPELASRTKKQLEHVGVYLRQKIRF